MNNTKENFGFLYGSGIDHIREALRGDKFGNMKLNTTVKNKLDALITVGDDFQFR